jgi:hypothetical protein
VDRTSISTPGRPGADGICGANRLDMAEKQKSMSTILRLVGAIVLLVGAVIAAVAAYGWVSAPAVTSADSVQVGGWFSHQWSIRWRLSSAVLILIGLSTAFAGIALILRRAWGFLLLATASMVAAVFPWLLQAAGMLHFTFEVPRAGETLICVAVAACSAAAYFLFRGPRFSHDGVSD